MMRSALLVVAISACSKPAPQGLPPASDWNQNHAAPSGSAKAEPGPLPPGHPTTLPPGHPPTQPPGHPDPADTASDPPPAPAATEPKLLEKLGSGRHALGPYSIAVPAGWTEVATKSSMRAGQFAIGSDAELVVYYFGPDGAGSVQDNIDRWIGQFTPADGKAPKDAAKIERTKILGAEATIVTISGRYQAMAMPGTNAVDKQDQSLIAAITGSESGPYYWKLVGSRATVAANAAKFRALLAGLKKK